MKRILLISLSLAALAAGGVWFYGLPFWQRGEETAKKKDEHKHQSEEEHVTLGRHARENLGLRFGKIELSKEPYWRSVTIPGLVSERPGSCERQVSAPMAGIVRHIAGIRGEIVRTGETLFTVEIISEHIHTLQADLFKSWREQQLVQQEKKRLEEPFKSGALPVRDMIAIDNQLKRAETAVQSRVSELQARGFSARDIEQSKEGKFVRQINVTVPTFASGGHDDEVPASRSLHQGYEIEEMKVMLGELVQPGQALAVLADHFHLFVEGKVFATEAGPIQRAAKQGLPIEAEFAGDVWEGSPRTEPLKVVNIASRVDAPTQTLGFFLQLANQHQEYVRDGKTYRFWRHRPGQKVQLRVPVEPFSNVFVLPAEAIVHEGPEVYVFRRESPSLYERVKVRLLHEDRRVAILANDGSVQSGEILALNCAMQLNWTFKSQGNQEDAHGHGHSHPHPHPH